MILQKKRKRNRFGESVSLDAGFFVLYGRLLVLEG